MITSTPYLAAHLITGIVGAGFLLTQLLVKRKKRP